MIVLSPFLWGDCHWAGWVAQMPEILHVSRLYGITKPGVQKLNMWWWLLCVGRLLIPQVYWGVQMVIFLSADHPPFITSVTPWCSPSVYWLVGSRFHMWKVMVVGISKVRFAQFWYLCISLFRMTAVGIALSRSVFELGVWQMRGTTLRSWHWQLYLICQLLFFMCMTSQVIVGPQFLTR